MTWACADCGFGEWPDEVAEDHATSLPEHVVYPLHHQTIPEEDAVIDVTECPDCSQKGTYEPRILIGGRGVYTCPEGHRWQNADEKPSSKGVPLRAPDTRPGGQGSRVGDTDYG